MGKSERGANSAYRPPTHLFTNCVEPSPVPCVRPSNKIGNEMSLTTRLLSSLVAGIAAAVFATTSSAAPLAYQESVSGDLPGIGVLPILTLDIGSNTVSGTTGFPVEPPLDFDSFAFMIPVGSVLVSASVQLMDVAGNTGDFVIASWRLYSGSSTADSGTLIELLEASSPGSDALTSTPLGAGLYNFTALGLGVSLVSLANYTFTLTLREAQAIPEPGTLLLAGLALAGLASTRGRRIRVPCSPPRR